MVGRAQSAPRKSQGGCGGAQLEEGLRRGVGEDCSHPPSVTCQLRSRPEVWAPATSQDTPHSFSSHIPRQVEAGPGLTWRGHLLTGPRGHAPGLP